MFMSKRTVEGIRSKILEKMDVRSSVGLAMYAVKNSLFFLETPGKGGPE